MISAGGISWTTGTGIMDGTQAVAGAVTSIFGYCLQGDIMEIQKNLQLDKIAHEETMENIGMEDQLNSLNQKEKNMHMAQEMHGKALTQKKEVGKLKADGRVLDAQKYQHDLTQKQGSINQRSLRMLFCDYRGRVPSRNTRNMGSPVKTR